MSEREAVEAIARKLTKAQREAVLALHDELWTAGPNLDDVAIDGITPARSLGLIEREFGDMGDPQTKELEDGVSFKVSACWWFRLTPLGRAVRDHLKGTDHET